MTMDIFGGWGPTLAKGTWMTIEVALMSALFGNVIGLLGAAACLSPMKAVRAAAHAYITAIRGLPQLLLILLVYFGSTVALTRLLSMLCRWERWKFRRTLQAYSRFR
jgi:His/Glu/Gln/Arg/opine family amino acid ABC transporter permease subunit